LFTRFPENAETVDASVGRGSFGIEAGAFFRTEKVGIVSALNDSRISIKRFNFFSLPDEMTFKQILQA